MEIGATVKRLHIVRLMAVIGTLGAGACASYRPAVVEMVPAGSDVRAELAESAQETVAEFTRGPERRWVEGRLLGSSQDSVVLELWRTDVIAGAAFAPGLVRVPLGREEVLDVAVRQTSVLKTGALVAGAVGTLLFLYQVFEGSVGGGGGGGGGIEIDLIPTRSGP
jgi:hypothetical protein